MDEIRISIQIGNSGGGTVKILSPKNEQVYRCSKIAVGDIKSTKDSPTRGRFISISGIVCE